MLRILNLFNKNQKIVLAFSGGNDSFLLAYLFKNFSYNFKIVFVNTPFHSERFLNFAKKKAELLNLNLDIINIDIFPKIIFKNSRNRCYYCKKSIFSEIKKKYKDFKITDGSNFSDTSEYRPGLKAIEELKIISPFKELKISKQDIFKYYKNNNLEKFVSHPSTCLATRVKYGIEITEKILKNIDYVENFLGQNGIEFSRLRAVGNNEYFIEILENQFNLISENLITRIKSILNTEQLKVREYKSGVFD